MKHIFLNSFACLRLIYGRLILLLCFLFISVSGYSQLNEWVYKSDHAIDPAQKGELRFELDNISFFKDNEFEGQSQKGYTLPGLWIQPKLIYFPLRNMKLELGMNLLRYWGTNQYPDDSYEGIPVWNDKDASHGLGHILPFFRFQVELYDHVSVVLGDIYGGANHQLDQALYNPEYNLTADPETGVQLLFDYDHFMLDGWIDWQSFIYNGDDHQEKFIAGISSKVKFMRPESRFQLNLPLQAVFRHQGGEIDNAEGAVKTWVNGSAGLEMSYTTGRRTFKKIGFTAMGLCSSQQAGEVLPVGKGLAMNTSLYAEVKDLRLSLGYWKGDDFFTITGSPFFSCLSTQDESYVFDKPSMAYGTLEYVRQFGKGFAFGGELSVYQRFACDYKGLRSDVESDAIPFVERQKSATSLSIGVYLRINPSVLLWRFKSGK